MTKRNYREPASGTATTWITPILLCLLVCSFAQADETAGKSWPPAQRVSYDQIDHSVFNQLLKNYVDQNGMVNYEAWLANESDRKSLSLYLEALGKADESKKYTKSAKIAYWINAYNALTIEGILRVYPTTSIRKHTAKVFGYNIWEDLKLTSGNQLVSLDDIEHRILRLQGEPRIHFAIVCASNGCPRLLSEAYTATKLEQQLRTNTSDFFSRNQNLLVDKENKKLKLSQIMSWFGTDFGKTQVDQLKQIAPYFPAEAKTFVKAGGYTIEFLKYDWQLNSQ